MIKGNNTNPTIAYPLINSVVLDVLQNCKNKFLGLHFRLPRFDSPLTMPSEVKINGRRILPVIKYYIKNALFIKCLYPSLYPVV